MGLINKLLAAAAAAALLCGLSVRGEEDGALAGSYGLPEVIADLEVHSARHSRAEDYAQAAALLTTQGYEPLLEDDLAAVYLREENASLRVVDKRSGYVWGGLDGDEEMNKTWTSFGNGMVAIDVVDSKLVSKKQGLGYPEETTFSYTVDGASARFEAEFAEYGISFGFTVALDDGDLLFCMDTSQIQETGDYWVQNVYFVPFLGCTREDETPGYFFLPDGSGALMRFQKASAYNVVYDQRVYGKDYAIDQTAQTNDLNSSRPNDFLVGEHAITLPVFGGVHGVKQHGFVAEITQGAEYAAVTATPAGMTTPYNWIAARFIVRQNYMQPTSKSGAGIQVSQKQANQYTACVRYHFLDGEEADYVGMAKWTRTRLQQEGALADRTDGAEGGIPLQLDVIMADVRRGLLSNGVEAVTTASQVSGLMDFLEGEGIGNVQYVLKGWQSGGLNGYNPEKPGFEKRSGSAAEYRALIAKASAAGGTVVFFEDPVDLTEKQAGYSGYTAHTMSQMPVEVVLENDTLLYNTRLYTGLDILPRMMEASRAFYGEHDIRHVALGSVGGVLYADQYRGEEVYRDQALSLLTQAVEAYAQSGLETAFYTPNRYMLPYCAAYYDMPLTNSQFQFETDSVPFLPIVLRGSVDYFAPYVNEGLFSQTDILKMVEYGAYPSYILTGKQNFELSDTASNQLYSTYIDEWTENMVSTYRELDQALRPVAGSAIEGREVLQEGVVRVDYANGVAIYVNYLGSAVTADGVTVPAQDYLVRG